VRLERPREKVDNIFATFNVGAGVAVWFNLVTNGGGCRFGK
jgi:hypothetical protein